MKKIVGQTKDVGFQFGLRKTFQLPQDQVWEFMFSPTGLDIWLGKLATELELNKSFRTESGIEGHVRVLKPLSHVRMSWKKPEWDQSSTLQVRIMGNEKKTTISFHQEKLTDGDQRKEMKEYWDVVMSELTARLDNT